MELKGKVAVITGASSGIGKGVAQALANAGMRLVLTARRESLLRQLAEELAADTAVVAGNIAEASLPQTLIDTAIKQFGSCDVVFNNAGIMIVGPAQEIDLDAVCQMLDKKYNVSMYRVSSIQYQVSSITSSLRIWQRR